MSNNQRKLRTIEEKQAILDYAKEHGPKAAMEKYKLSSPAFYTMRKKLNSSKLAKSSTASIQRHSHTAETSDIKMKIINILLDYVLHH